MTTIRNTIRQHAVLIYFVLTILLTWGGMALALYPGGFPMTDEQFAASGPLVYTAMLVGPTGAGLLMTALVDGRAGLRALLSRLVRWRVNIRWYAAALAAPLLMAGILLALSQFSPAFRPAILAADNKLALVLSSVAAGLAVGLFEEIGWTGFAIPRLRERYGVLAAGLIVGVVWGAWHFPPFWQTDTFTGVFPLALLLAQLFAWLPPYRALMVWVYDRTGSLLVAVLMHASLMAGLSTLVPAELSGTALLTWILCWAAAVWLIAGAATLLSRQPVRRPARQQTT